MLLTASQLIEITHHLERGDKKKLAEFIGVTPRALTKWLGFRKDVNGWVIPKYAYKKALEFKKINSI